MWPKNVGSGLRAGREDSVGILATPDFCITMGKPSGEAAPKIYNINVGVVGHVDSGKTSLGTVPPLAVPSMLKQL